MGPSKNPRQKLLPMWLKVSWRNQTPFVWVEILDFLITFANLFNKKHFVTLLVLLLCNLYVTAVEALEKKPKTVFHYCIERSLAFRKLKGSKNFLKTGKNSSIIITSFFKKQDFISSLNSFFYALASYGQTTYCQ